MNKNEFKAAVTGLWEGLRRSVSIVNTLEGLGVFLDPNKENPSGFSGLYGIQDAAAKAIAEMTGMQVDSFLEEVDSFLLDSADTYEGREGLPDEVFDGLVEIVNAYGGNFIEEADDSLFYTNDHVVRHRALRTSDCTPVTGYVWEGSNHAYIIPGNAGISYDEKTQTLTAPAVEVDKDTIAANMRYMDDQMDTLYEGDTVRLGIREITVGMNFDLMCNIAHRRKEKGLRLVKRKFE